MTRSLLCLMLAATTACAPLSAPQASGAAVAAAADGGAIARDGDAIVADLLSRMSIESKVAQIVMPDISTLTPEDMKRYRFGTILNGGNSGPGGNDRAPAPEWLMLADAFWAASTAPRTDGEPVIPHLWATDAVHGHNNIIGATLFPHNVGLGATRDRDLMSRIGKASAIEVATTGIDWTFAPTIAVTRDLRWGRAYESFGQDPAIVGPLGAAMIEGLQGKPGDRDFLRHGRVIATAKHFFGDGGTQNGIDQGDTIGSEDALIALHASPYVQAIDSGVQTVMSSFSSINGEKLHGSKSHLTGLLRGRLGFDGLVVGDWNGHGQVAGCTNQDCPKALLAGLDVYMAPEDWKALYANLVRQARDGTIPAGRLDEAAGRVLRLKLKAGLFDAGAPSTRAYAGDWARLGSAEHRAIAREAVAKSLVVLRNDGTLPLRSDSTILVAGRAADSIAQQSGGWTISWQGGETLTNADFPGAQSIYDAIAGRASAGGGRAILFADGEAGGKVDAAVVVFGEPPYAEFSGDRKDLLFRDEEALTLLRKLRARGIPTVAVFLSGRPMWVTREINAAGAFVAAWLPGSEGGGVADVLYGDRPASGRLPFAWPAACDADPMGVAAPALFPLGYGLPLDVRTGGDPLAAECRLLTAGAGEQFPIFGAGQLGQGVEARVGGTALPALRGAAGGLTARGIDKDAQESARLLTFERRARLDLQYPPATKTESGMQPAIAIDYAVPSAPSDRVDLQSGCAGQDCAASFDATAQLRLAAGKGWRQMVLTGQCLPGVGRDGSMSISASGFDLQIASIRRIAVASGTGCSF